jgi:phosphatidylinositol glycan class U
MPLFFNLWVYYGSGNANFFYAITLLYNAAQIFFVLEFVYASLLREWDLMYPGLRKARVELVFQTE